MYAGRRPFAAAADAIEVVHRPGYRCDTTFFFSLLWRGSTNSTSTLQQKIAPLKKETMEQQEKCQLHPISHYMSTGGCVLHGGIVREDSRIVTVDMPPRLIHTHGVPHTPTPKASTPSTPNQRPRKKKMRRKPQRSFSPLFFFFSRTSHQNRCEKKKKCRSNHEKS